MILALLLGLAITPLTRTHSHNDYAQKRPLLEALDHGFCSIEADIFLVDGKLLVGHSAKELKPERTLQAMYLDPLMERVKANRGRVYPDGPEIILLIDVKSEAKSTFQVLRTGLRPYEVMLSNINPRAVRIIVSGNRDEAAIAEDRAHLTGIDGRSTDIDSNEPAYVMPLISESWDKLFKWNGEGEMPVEQKTQMAEFVKKVHQRHRKVRFWGAADTPAMWAAQYKAGVDLINTDHIADLAKFLRKQ